eukprot:754045-Hanusia_phi.AAC.6
MRVQERSSRAVEIVLGAATCLHEQASSCSWYVLVSLVDLMQQRDRRSQSLASSTSRMGRKKPWKLFYNIGAIFGFLGLFFSVLLLLFNLIVNVRTLIAHPSPGTIPSESLPSGQLASQQYTVTALFPGLNLPLAHIFYVLAATLVCLVVHEAGHALCAGAARRGREVEVMPAMSGSEGVKVQDCGVFLYFFIPGAFVELDPVVLACGSGSS